MQNIIKVLGVGLSCSIPLVYTYGTPFEKNITIKKKFTRVKGGRDSSSQIFMVCDNNNDNYKVEKSILWLKFNATELWTDLEDNKNYNIKGYGWRVGFLNLYPNIISAVKM